MDRKNKNKRKFYSSSYGNTGFMGISIRGFFVEKAICAPLEARSGMPDLL